MNKEYIYDDGQVTIIDEKGLKKKINYNDNLDEILVIENVIEELKKRKNQIINSLKEIGKVKKQSCLKLFFHTILTSIISIPIAISLTMFIWDFIKFDYIKLLETSSNLSFDIEIFLPFMITSLALGFNYLDYLYKGSQYNEKKGLELELLELNKQLELNQEKLKKLEEKAVSSTKKTNFQVYKVDYLQQLRDLRKKLIFYHKLGFNEDIYLKYYQNNELEEKLQGNSTEEEIQNAKKYLEQEHKKRLIKRKK